jgi:hypothetical protein
MELALIILFLVLCVMAFAFGVLALFFSLHEDKGLHTHNKKPT